LPKLTGKKTETPKRETALAWDLLWQRTASKIIPRLQQVSKPGKQPAGSQQIAWAWESDC